MKVVQLHDKKFKPYIPVSTINDTIDRVANQINNDYQGKTPLFLVVLNGAFMFASDLLKNVTIDCEISFVKLASYEGTRTTGEVKQLVGLNEDINNRDVVIIEDIVDTGVTMENLINILKRDNPNSVEVVTLLYKPEAFRKDFEIKYVGFDVPNDFLVGYGLDYDGLGRNLDSLYTIIENKTNNNMLNIVLFGPPGAGKGTQSEKLIEKYGLVHLSTGDIFRANIKGETELGKLAKSYMDKGQLVPDEVTIKLLESEVNKHEAPKGFIFDGFPRTSAQSEALDAFLTSKGTAITQMLALDVEENELKTRLLERAKTSGRADDADPAIIQNRINVYNAETAPVKDYYQNQNKFVAINGIGSIEEITSRLYSAIDGVVESI